MGSKFIWIFFTFILLNLQGCLTWSLSLFDKGDEWNGKFFPHAEGEADTNPIVDYNLHRKELYDEKHGIKMGIPTKHCDDGKWNLEQDWLDDPVNYTCYDNKVSYLPRDDVYPLYIKEHIPVHYSALHRCMNKEIIYDNDVPTFGTHRPLWAKYGEYRFVPRQRWLHNLEHGAIVMLYHPCANGEEVNLLRHLVVNCLYRHVITPYTLLTPERPLALLAWGRKLVMSKVDPSMVKEFIKISAKHGPEHTSKDGQYDYELLQHAIVVTNKNDDVLCSDFSDAQTME